ncbi:MAG: hypothetical protein IPK50_01810 [Fibrobacterota bacterium]|nr:hypothetical protein [Fibrobacterota bacterium]QQS05635.1 MAG: hypothetical protein IPK50_01810 [Fibrobacterota bacterium]
MKFEKTTPLSEPESGILVDLSTRLSGARLFRDKVRICPNYIQVLSKRPKNGIDLELLALDGCMMAAFYSGKYRQAGEYAEQFDRLAAKVANVDPDYAQDQIDRLRMQAEINSVLRRDREVLRLLLPSLAGWGDIRALRLAILRTYPPKEIIAEFDQAIDSMNVANYEDAPPTIQAKADTLFENLGKGKEIGWTRLFGVDMVFCLGGEEPFFGFPREAYVKEITESSLYAEMYCLPSSKDSAALLQDGGPR